MHIFHKQENDGTVRYVLALEDDHSVECVYFASEQGSLCISSQVGCSLSCRFCRTGADKLVRNMTEDEIVEQLTIVREDLGLHGDKRVRVILYQGMGEPLLNYGPVVGSMRRFLALPDAPRLYLATAGVTPGVIKLADEGLPVQLWISLHGTQDEARKRVMPHTEQYPLTDFFHAAEYYQRKVPSQVVNVNYLLLKGINDSAEDAARLANMLKGRGWQLVLRQYCPTGMPNIEGADDAGFTMFAQALDEADVRFSVSWSFGVAIEAGCGQLRQRVGAVGTRKHALPVVANT